MPGPTHLILPQESRSQKSHTLVSMLLLLAFKSFRTRVEGPPSNKCSLLIEQLGCNRDAGKSAEIYSGYLVDPMIWMSWQESLLFRGTPLGQG